MNFITKSPAQTKKLGEILAKEILKTKTQKRARILGLEGDLGGGKSTFLQGFAKGLGIKQKILSPTFLIVKRFKIPNSSFRYFYHIDCYRIKRAKEILILDFKKTIASPQNIVAAEWSEQIRKILPKDTLFLKFKFLNKTTRRIFLK
jgi:tRNA threonylcarbamoyladenosine biosynthesis protein TsaE